ncbi:ferredoxin [Amycolatopsis taiwanensis]|uniref:Ferredoxin n=1 Tax=Amycolatopsis taiwanensis TaxID=342230 RepID=A0A9W6R9F3_9PSEU|nr:(4Fe-4S)-binding protein [Amycolatopsis taiwanensis]GLY71474.1 ferredoxin [Amycolatopsis taiwanensis]
MRIVADTNVCVGAGQCVLTDPKVFDQSEDDGTVIVLNEHPDDLEKARVAVNICPSGALSLVEE